VLSWLWLNAVAFFQAEFGHPERGATLNLHTISSNLCLALTYDQGNVRLAIVSRGSGLWTNACGCYRVQIEVIGCNTEVAMETKGKRQI